MTTLTSSPAAANANAVLAAADPAQYLTFMLAGEVFAIGILAVKEIIEYHSLTSVPMMPDCVRGVINLRGAVVPVMDLLARFGRASSDVTKRTCIVIVEVRTEQESQVVGVIVDAVNEVLDIAPSDIEPAPAFGARIRTDFIQGMGKVKGKFVILLNADHVLSLDEITQLAQAPANGAALALN
ncbi:MAG: purine-binding chemotaxis protein CheW [Rubrivivax sp.]|nr:MAG: purine-binding chemotaxis protein CheW [Rubrivivax sp.]